MKYYVTIVTTMFVLASSLVEAGTLNMLPMRPAARQSVTIEFKPSKDQVDWVQNAASFHAVVFAFGAEDDVPLATEVPLSKDGKRWSGTYEIPAGVVYAMVKAGDGRRYDSHRELYWEMFVHTKDGKPVKSAEMRAAVSWLGSLPKPCNRKADQVEAGRLMNSEVSNYPDNIVAQVNNVFLQMSQKAITPQTAAQQLGLITGMAQQPKSPLEAVAIVQAYRQQGKQAEAAKAMSEAIARFPDSRVAEQQSLEGLRSATSVEQLTTMVEAHLAAFPESFARQDLINTVVTASTKEGKLVSLLKFFDNVDRVSAGAIHAASNYIGAQDSLRPQGLKLIERGLDAAKDESLKPRYIGITEWGGEQKVSSSLLFFVRGAIQQAQGDNDAAATSYKKSLEYGGEQSDKGVYSRYAKLLKRNGDEASALETCSLAIQRGASDQTTLNMYRELSAKQGQSENEIEGNIEQLTKNARGLIAERLASERLNQPMIDGTFTDMEGKPIKISDWSGKVVILDYWATWCGPCRKSFPSMEKLYQKYKSNPNVQFAIVNVWERVEDPVQHVEEFLGKNPGLTFPVFFDGTEVVRKYGVTGIPTKFYLGRDGRIQFKEVGYLPEEQFLNEATNKIEALLSQE